MAAQPPQLRDNGHARQLRDIFASAFPSYQGYVRRCRRAAKGFRILRPGD